MGTVETESASAIYMPRIAIEAGNAWNSFSSQRLRLLKELRKGIDLLNNAISLCSECRAAAGGGRRRSKKRSLTIWPGPARSGTPRRG